MDGTHSEWWREALEHRIELRSSADPDGPEPKELAAGASGALHVGSTGIMARIARGSASR